MRLAKGTRLLNPWTATYHKYGGRWVEFIRWTIDYRIVVRMEVVYYLVNPEQVGLESPVKPAQQRMFQS